jgi:peptidoglycan/LPS O-acetylase OafA/YrhL
LAQPEDRPSFHRTQASVWLDALRGAAAIMVLLTHWRYLLFCGLHAIPNHQVLYAVPYLLTAGGSAAVIVFFVLSGFLVGGSALRAFQQHQWHWKRYLTHRLVRLWVVLLPALPLGVFWDIWQIKLLARYHDPRAAAAIAELSSHVSWKLAIANALFLQGQLFHTLGTNHPLWSLSYEFWYYLLFPLALCALWPRAYKPAARALWLLAFALAFLFVAKVIGWEALQLFPAWLIGAALHFAPRRKLPKVPGWLAVTIFALFFEALLPLQQHHTYAVDMTIAAATGLLLWLLLSDLRLAREHSIAVRAARRTAGFSYTLYLVHNPILVFLAVYAGDDSNWQPDLHHLTLGLGLLALIVAYSWLIWLATEARTDTVRRWVERMLPNNA